MNIEQRILNHNKRWNVEFDGDQQFLQFKSRLIQILNKFIGKLFTNNVKLDEEFNERLLYTLGKEISVETFAINSIISPVLSSFNEELKVNKGFGDTCIYKSVKTANNIVELATVLQVMFWILEKHDSFDLLQLTERLKELIQLAPDISFQISVNKKGIVLYPAGAKLLDEEIVNDVLDWLNNYPQIANSFKQALNIRMSKDSGKYRNLLDNLRFCVEQLLKDVLGNNKSLENQKPEILNWLNRRGVHREIVNLYNQLLFNHYCKYQNEAVKHNEAFSEKEIEFMIYLTGIFMRLLLQLI